MEALIESLRLWLVDSGPRLLSVLILLVAAWAVSFWVRRAVLRTLEHTRVDLTLTKFFGSASRWVVLLFAGLGALSLLGVETSDWTTLVAAGGIAIGLAFKDTLNNFATGFMLLLLRPFKVGDTVRVGGETGVVDEIALFSTRLDTFDHRRIVIPNSAVFGSTIENITYHPTRRVDVPVGVDYDADVDRTREALEQAAREVPGGVAEPAPTVVIKQFGGSSVDWEVRVWAKRGDFLAVKQATLRAIKLALDEAGIGIPFPQMDVHLDRRPS